MGEAARPRGLLGPDYSPEDTSAGARLKRSKSGSSQCLDGRPLLPHSHPHPVGSLGVHLGRQGGYKCNTINIRRVTALSRMMNAMELPWSVPHGSSGVLSGHDSSKRNHHGHLSGSNARRKQQRRAAAFGPTWVAPALAPLGEGSLA